MFGGTMWSSESPFLTVTHVRYTFFVLTFYTNIYVTKCN